MVGDLLSDFNQLWPRFAVIEFCGSKFCASVENKILAIEAVITFGNLCVIRYEKSQLVKLDVLLNKEMVDAFSMIVHESEAYDRARFVCKRLKEVIPMHQFEVPVQAAVGQKIIARETVKAYRKDVIAKCYGGDISRKKKLLEKQKEGKKRMRQFGRVEVPQEAFTAVLKYDEDK